MTNKNIPYLTDPLENEHWLDFEITHIGRGVENEIVIISNRASREHAIIRRDGRKIFLEDLGSTNGSFLNGERVMGSAQLRDGDQVTIGDVVFTFHDPDTTTRETPFPELEVNVKAGEVRLNRKLLSLSPKEFALVAYLYENRGNVCSKDDIGRAVWAEYQSGIFDYQIENLVRRLRTKIEIDPNSPMLLVTIRGLGYKLTAP
ncbi:MAG: transcriptional regulator [Chloroflexi bacterium HGW-Chloroflexi-6]|nr:MAG: transcriptional regulator [Chloroflexi bacterium HGW-Chloroflexi-6]